MISINKLSYFLGNRILYNEARLFINAHDKIGLIGFNGTGKSTLLHIISGTIVPSEGDISMSKDCKLGFLNQDLLSTESDETILQIVLSAFEEINNLQKKIDTVIHKIENDYQDKWVEQLSNLQNQFDILEGYSIQTKAEEILEGIGFSTKDLRRPLNTFSGGWRMRVILAKILLERPSLLMLDEPTNHLDLPSIEWLEQYLKSYNGAFIIVSHDRNFLNATCNKTVEVARGKLNMYEGNYDFYEKEKIIREELQRNSFQNQQQKIKETERFIERFRSKATKAKQVQSRVKMLEKMSVIENVVDTSRRINIKFSFSKSSGKEVLALEHVTKKYDNLTIFENASSNIVRGDKIALIGANGVGKSTLLRLIAGNEDALGTIKMGYNVEPTFYAQHQLEALNLDYEILEELKTSGAKKTEQELRECLGCFLFSGDDVYKKIKVLSGGEKSRVALAKVLISEANFLLLDEPTNHLDMLSENILIQSLQQYKGTIIMVSHNRHFISKVANKIWYIQAGKIKEYPGTYKEYLWWVENQGNNNFEDKKNISSKKKKNNNNRNLHDNSKKVLLKELKVIEKKIVALEENISLLQDTLHAKDNELNFELLSETQKKLDESILKLNQHNKKWDVLIVKIDKVG